MTSPESSAGAVLPWSDARRPGLSRVERSLEHAIAVGYSAAYDAVVRGFAPYEALVDKIVSLLARAEEGRRLRVLDVACGTGTIARRLAREGHSVVGVDTVAHLVKHARRRGGDRIEFQHADVAAVGVFADASFDACVSLHTLSLHPRPIALLAECRRLVRPRGHAIILSYTRPADVRATFAAVRAREGVGRAVVALRWLVPTAVFEAFRHYTPRYPDTQTLHRAITAAGFEIYESRPVFLAGLSRLVWARAAAPSTVPNPSIEETIR